MTCAACCVQYPGASGRILDPRELVEDVAARGGLSVVAADLLALTLLESPGRSAPTSWSAARSASACRCSTAARTPGSWLWRRASSGTCPGGWSASRVDAHGKPAYRLALQTREQHIRRDRATSNICTAQVLLAVTAAMYAVYHGPEGLTAIARRTHRCATVLAAALREGGVEVEHSQFFDTVVARVPGRAAEVVDAAHVAGVHLRGIDADHVGISCSERTGLDTVAAVLTAFGVEAESLADVDVRDPGRAAGRAAARQHRSSSTRCSTPTARRPRCCATCAGSRPATTRSTGA